MHDAQVESSLPQLLHLGCADLLANVELDPRVPRANAANQLRQKIEHRASDDPQANRPLFTARNAADEVGGVRGLFEQGARARDERRAGRRQGHAATGALEQPGAELGLEARERLGQRRL